MTDVLNIQPHDAPDFVSILLCCLLFKLGGQISLSLGAIEQIQQQFPSIRLTLSRELGADCANEILTLTLRSRDHVENDHPPRGQT
jgi:hypothetical protein